MEKFEGHNLYYSPGSL